MSRAPTTREIAAACRCSQSTVSNALRDHPRISIQGVARSMGWQADPLAAEFMAHLRSTRRPPTERKASSSTTPTPTAT